LVRSLLEDGGAGWVLASFLVFGILLAFTPCVFPMYPILGAAIAGAGDNVKPTRALLLSAVYVFSMSLAFGLLGVAAAWSGRNLQVALQSPYALLGVSGLFIALALSMFGLYELQLPSRWVNSLSRVGGGRSGSLLSTAVLGFSAALIVGPCVTAPLAGALLYIAQTGNVALGALALFTLGVGKGIPLIMFGVIGQRLMPKAGTWMEGVKKAFGLVFVGNAIWLVSRLIPGEYVLALWSVFLIGTGAWLGAFDSLLWDAPASRRWSKAVGVAASLYGVAAKDSGACHAGLCQGDGPVIGGLAEATQLYHDVGPWSCLGSAIVRC
jgi:thiol:disulfide interchange protein DsbD